MLTLSNLSKRFGSLQALDRLSLSLDAGEIVDVLAFLRDELQVRHVMTCADGTATVAAGSRALGATWSDGPSERLA